MYDLANRVVFVTGAGRGVGRSIALKFAEEGARVAAISRTEAQLNAVAAEASACGRVHPIVADVSDADAVSRAVAETREKLGPVDVLINNAAVYMAKPITETTLSEWENIFKINVSGPFMLTRLILPQMLKRDEGRIINICSTASHIGYPDQSAYVASKHALLGFTRVTANETHGTNIRVHALSPGGVNTTMTAGRPGIDATEYMAPAEVAEMALFLARTNEIAMLDELVVRRKGSMPFRC